MEAAHMKEVPCSELAHGSCAHRPLIWSMEDHPWSLFSNPSRFSLPDAADADADYEDTQTVLLHMLVASAHHMRAAGAEAAVANGYIEKKKRKRVDDQVPPPCMLAPCLIPRVDTPSHFTARRAKLLLPCPPSSQEACRSSLTSLECNQRR